jgi:type IV secretion system protein VirD4
MDTWKQDHPGWTFIGYYLVSIPLFLLTSLLDLYQSFLLHEKLEFPSGLLYLLPILPLLSLVALRPRRRADSHGSSHWATMSELKQANLIERPEPPMRLALLAPGQADHASGPARESLLLVGYAGHAPIVLPERKQQSHLLIVAPTGKRKSSGFFIPWLLEEGGQRSMLINDVKGELYRLCAGAVSNSHDVLVFSPTMPQRSNAYNPLAHIKSSKDARDFARAWVANTGLSEEEFYNNASRTLIAALVLHLIDTEPDPPLSDLADLVSTKTLDEVKTLLLDSSSSRARKTAGAFVETLQANPKVAAGIMLGISNRFSILVDSEDYRQVTAHNEISFERMVDGPRATALFLQIPASATVDLQPLSAVLVMQMMNYLTRRAERERDGRLPRPFVLYLDEFANAGRIPDIESHISLVRGAAIAVIAAAQDFGQLTRVYGKEIASTFLANFTTQIALPGLGQLEADYYSRRLGTATITNTSSSASTRGGSILPTTTTQTRAEIQRPLLLPDEIRTMPVGSFLMVSDNVPPIRGTFRTYLERPELQALLRRSVRRLRVRVVEETALTPRPANQTALPPPDSL